MMGRLILKKVKVVYWHAAFVISIITTTPTINLFSWKLGIMLFQMIDCRIAVRRLQNGVDQVVSQVSYPGAIGLQDFPNGGGAG
jgi:hypothetical protein